MLRYLVSPRLALVLLAGLGAQIASPRTLVAQDQPVVFIHGLFLGSGEWQATANLFTQQFQIRQIVPTLGWGNSFETQASNLQGALGSLMQVAALGHSNGGLVERQYVRQFGAGTRLNRGFTVGTPHRGAQLAQYVRDGTAGRYAQFLFNSIIDPFDFYYWNDPDFQDAVDFGPLFVAGGLMEAMAFIAYYFVPILNQVAVPVSNAIPVGAEMVPASPFLAALNSSGNLSAEQANMPTRVGAATSVSPQNAFFTLFSNDPGAWGNVRVGVEYFALLLYDYYSSHPDFFLQANAWRWYNLAGAMAFFDVDWQLLIGSVLYVDNFGTVFVEKQDGLVPLSSQTWPGASFQENRLWPTYTIPHRAQVTHPVMVGVMQNVLNVRFGIPVRPPPLTASISGPTYITSTGTYTWTGNPAGGTGPYSYQWSYQPQGGSWTNLGTAQTQSRSISSTTPDFSLKVVVTDPVGSGSSTIYVANGLSDPDPGGGGGCSPCSPTCKC